MPLLDATFYDPDGKVNHQNLLTFGPTVGVVVGHFPQTASLNPTVVNQTESVLALVDTGAFESCIDDALAQRLGLPIIDTMQISGSNGAATHNVYAGLISIVGLEFSQYGRFAGVHLSAGQQVHSVLLGRTFLQHTMLIYDGIRGQISFACPQIVGNPT